jgi:hypothetical protein
MEKVKSFIKKNFPGLVPIVRYIKIQTSQFRAVEPIFTEIYHKNFWEDPVSRSGPGSNLIQTKVIREELPILVQEIGARSLLDIPCGDFYWMKEVELDVDLYIGADVIQELVTDNIKRYGNKKRHFVKLDIIKDRLPQVDLLFCRDLLDHFSNRHIFRAIKNIKKSNSKYLLTTTFASSEKNENIIPGEWWPLNLQKAPFYFPSYIKIINENCTDQNGRFSGKSLGLWKITDI